MFVLGIDPGLSRCGYGAVRQGSGDRRRPVAEAAGVLSTPTDAGRAQRLAELQQDFRALVTELKPDVVAVERVLFQRNAHTAMAVAEAVGVVLAESAAAGCEAVEYSPNEVKKAVAGWGGADKQEITEMVKTLLGLKERLSPPDAADAVAVALCHLACAGPPAAVGRRAVAVADAR
ncbi:MAG: crossover junction endodeoxyribonuclease RuvC [Acidimicrobiaceae bacterium]|nr:crossover junction endodeoxyribonuclease RuvC [Acidimicrobiaceae bacterium]MCY4176016.1 crossover junction endodeoxyribonuclease RuvC [Acidimicrobiaceae bacterium]MCY4280151.1 crossover junction endodeoxyribonuclease RuvC [Acidimicrobiaceae bacterium]MCY4294008.1 crossover junction endodeoxyribonuclease RuvC [Acidimicrobiaceae bacterium]